MPTESDIQKQIFDYLIAEGFLVMRINGGRMGNISFVTWQAKGLGGRFTSGVSDLLALSPEGKLYAIEAKAPGKKAAPMQRTFMAEAARHGAIPILASRLEDVRDGLIQPAGIS